MDQFNADEQLWKELERDGIVARKFYGEVPLKVEYSLPEYGRTLRPLLKEL